MRVFYCGKSVQIQMKVIFFAFSAAVLRQLCDLGLRAANAENTRSPCRRPLHGFSQCVVLNCAGSKTAGVIFTSV